MTVTFREYYQRETLLFKTVRKNWICTSIIRDICLRPVSINTLSKISSEWQPSKIKIRRAFACGNCFFKSDHYACNCSSTLASVLRISKWLRYRKMVSPAKIVIKSCQGVTQLPWRRSSMIIYARDMDILNALSSTAKPIDTDHSDFRFMD